MDKILVYIDSSCLNRIFDDQSQPRILLESISMLVLFSFIESGITEIVSSEGLIFETENNPFEEKRDFVLNLLNKSKIYLTIDKEVLNRAEALERINIKGIDAFHIALSEKNNIPYFLTVDDGIIKKYQGQLQVINPVNFVMNIFGV